MYDERQELPIDRPLHRTRRGDEFGGALREELVGHSLPQCFGRVAHRTRTAGTEHSTAVKRRNEAVEMQLGADNSSPSGDGRRAASVQCC